MSTFQSLSAAHQKIVSSTMDKIHWQFAILAEDEISDLQEIIADMVIKLQQSKGTVNMLGAAGTIPGLSYTYVTFDYTDPANDGQISPHFDEGSSCMR